MRLRRFCYILAALAGPAAAQDVYGPTAGPAGPIGAERPARGFAAEVGAVKWELVAVAAYFTAANGAKVATVGPDRFRFKDEGWFGDDTINLGVDKLAHAHNTYLLADLIAARIRKKTGGSGGDGAITGAILASGFMAYAELFDGFKKTSGWSWQDIAMNTAGAGFSVLRASVPGLDRKLDFRVQITPNSSIYTFSGTRHYRQMRHLLALKLGGFERLERSPLRFVELHLGYRATGFTPREIARGDERRQRPFVGVGVNLRELFFKSPSTRIGRAAGEVLDYVQIPYTAAHFDLTKGRK